MGCTGQEPDPSPMHDVGMAAERSDAPVPGAPTHAVRVLVADDERAHRWLVRLQLQDEPDFEVIGEAGDAKEAVVQAGQLHPDLVIVDVEMPGDGVAALPALRAAAPEAVLVVLSAYADQHRLTERVSAGGGNAVLDKAKGVTDLAPRLREVLAHHVAVAG
jgi:DNA-binding NarL/FixJ family response regulator